MENSYNELLKKEVKTRLIDESFNRIRICLSLIADKDLNRSPGSDIPAISNQVEHICGNIRQWVLASIGGEEDYRDRDAEFETSNSDKEHLLELLADLEKELRPLIRSLKDEQFFKIYHIQGFKVSGLSALVHVVEHCSYHTGQITLLTKLFTGKDTGYYSGKDLNAKNQ